MKRIFILIVFFSLTIDSIHSQELSDLIQKGNELLFKGQLNESILHFQQALHVVSQEENGERLAEVHNKLAKAYCITFQLDSATHHAKEAQKLSRSQRNTNAKEEANALDNLGEILFVQRKSEEAYRLYLQAFELRKKQNPADSLDIAISYYKLGSTLQSQSKYEEADNYLQKVLKIDLEEIPEAILLKADTYESLGYIAYDNGRAVEALDYFQKGLEVAQKIFEENDPYFSDVYNQIGLVYSFKKQSQESLNYYQKALSISIENYGIDGHPSQPKIHYNMGTSYRQKGDVEKALFYTKKALNKGIEIFGDQHEVLFYPYSQMGQIYGDERGIPFLKKALAIFKGREDENPLVISHLYEYLAEVYYNIGDLEKALLNGEKALQIRLDAFGEKNVHSIRSRNHITLFLIELKHFDEALKYNEIAINLNDDEIFDEDLLLESVRIKSDIHFQLYRQSKQKLDLEKSMELNEQVLELIKSIRRKNRNFDDKIRFSETAKSVYANAIRFSLLASSEEEKMMEDSFLYSEKSRSNLLKESVRNTDAKRATNIPSQFLERETELNTQIAELASKIVKESYKKESDVSVVLKMNAEILDLRASRDSLIRRMEIEFPDYYQYKYQSENISVSSVQEKLPDNTSLVEFFKWENTLYTFVINKESFHVEESNVDGIEEKIQEFTTRIVEKDQLGFSQVSKDLYDLLIKPIDSYFVGDQLIIVPDESLWNLHFDLLLTGDTNQENPNYLLNQYAISYANSATLLFRESMNRKSGKSKEECLAFSYSSSQQEASVMSLQTLRNSEVDLPGTRKEVRELSEVFGGTYYYGSDANEKNFKDKAHQYQLIHLALHGEIDHLNPTNSKIYFTDLEGENFEDNTLYAHELYAMDIPADLVVLSACDTGAGKVNKGEGILSLGSAFQSAGVESLLLSKWQISDKTTPEIMKFFYQNLSKGMNKSKALQKAKLQFLETSDVFNEAPFYWGSFYVLGDITPIEQGMDGNEILILMGLLSLITFIFLIWRRKSAKVQ